MPQDLLAFQLLIDLVPIGEVVGNGAIHFLQPQGRIELRFGFRVVAFLECDHDGVERNYKLDDVLAETEHGGVIVTRAELCGCRPVW